MAGTQLPPQTKLVKPKTKRGKRALLKREPKIVSCKLVQSPMVRGGATRGKFLTWLLAGRGHKEGHLATWWQGQPGGAGRHTTRLDSAWHLLLCHVHRDVMFHIGLRD